MAKALTEIPQVALLFETNEQAHRDILSGVLRYVRNHGPWSLHVAEGRPGEQRLLTMKAREGSGIIGVIQNRAYAQAVLATKVPAVLIDPVNASQLPPGVLDLHSVMASDQRAVGEMAAEFFLERQYQEFAYVGEVQGINWSRDRGKAFAKAAKQAGYPCHTYGPLTARQKKDWGFEREKLRKWLMSLPKPCALFAAMDVRGRQVLDACLTAGIDVPREISILAVDNDELICEATTPPLSSIQLNTERMGFEAARLLDCHLRSTRKLKKMNRTFAPVQVVSRQSTDAVQIDDRIVSEALSYIWLNAQSPIGVPDIVEHVGVSRRQLEKRFRKVMQRTLQGELQSTRLKRVRILLTETNLSVTAIARACGFTSKSYLGKVFRREHQITMSKWRVNNT
ncbi:MAG: XylR family transcriptional regulator [Kiritimatiellae bacterium]|nr:XylR family transcriptional regulator [Kiritimatiellia bacterium]